jgi:putative phosphoribosyl transferase
MFTNRREAGRMLATRLRKYKNIPGVVLAVPRGGIPVAYEIAKELNIPLEVILIKKLGHPNNKEYAIGAVGLKDSFVLPHENVTQYYIETEITNIRQRLKEMQTSFLGDKEPEDLANKTVIVVDDGVATGNTLLGTLQVIRKSNPHKIVLAVPVASQSAVEKLEPFVEEMVVLLCPESFRSVGLFYSDFSQVSDEEVLHYLNKLNATKKIS